MSDKKNQERQTYLTLIQIDNRIGKFRYEDEQVSHHYFLTRDARAVESVHRIYREGVMNGGTGKLSDNELRDAKNLFVISVTLITRYAVEAGMLEDLAFTLSDLWTQQIEGFQTKEELIHKNLEMVTEFYERLCSLDYYKTNNQYVTDAINFIVQNIDKDINSKVVSEAVHLSVNYLTKVFHQEMGESIHSSIKKQRMEAAKEMLRYTDYSYAEISAYLNFSSQSYFISQFRDSLGMTPREYRREKRKIEK